MIGVYMQVVDSDLLPFEDAFGGVAGEINDNLHIWEILLEKGVLGQPGWSAPTRCGNITIDQDSPAGVGNSKVALGLAHEPGDESSARAKTDGHFRFRRVHDCVIKQAHP